MVIYAICVIILLANIFIATLNDLFSAAARKVHIEMEDSAYDPIDYVLLNAKGGYWKVFTKIFNFTRSRKVRDRNTDE